MVMYDCPVCKNRVAYDSRAGAFLCLSIKPRCGFFMDADEFDVGLRGKGFDLERLRVLNYSKVSSEVGSSILSDSNRK
jgi:hypothetical protein